MPDTGRPPHLSTPTPGELQRTRRDLAAALAPARPGAPAQVPIRTHLDAIDAELASRAGQPPSPATTSPNGDRHMLVPGNVPGTEIDVEEVRGPLECTRLMRLALDTLEDKLPRCYESDGLIAELWALREKFAVAELIQLRKLGHREYLIVQPLDPAAPGPLITQAAQAVKTLDDLGLVIRLI